MRLTLLFIFLFTIISYSQETQPSNFQENKEIEECLNVRKSINSNSIAEKYSYDEIINKIVNSVGLKKNFTLIECQNIRNAVAYPKFIKDKGFARYIAYDREFMDEIEKNSNDWSKVGILAHEIGHHLNNHTFYKSSSKEEQRAKEIESDEFAGFVLQRLGATLDESKSFLKVISFDTDDSSSTHPKRSKRLKAIEKGYALAKKNNTISLNNERKEDKDNIDYPTKDIQVGTIKIINNTNYTRYVRLKKRTDKDYSSDYKIVIAAGQTSYYYELEKGIYICQANNYNGYNYPSHFFSSHQVNVKGGETSIVNINN